MTTSRRFGRRGDGSAVVNGWVAWYTLGLPAAIRDRRRSEVAGDLADETLDAVRRGTIADLRRRRITRLLLGIPADITWRLVEAPAAARALRPAGAGESWVPLTRIGVLLLALAGIGAAGALAIVVSGLVSGRATEETWSGWGPYGFVAACSIVLVAVVLAVPWPRRALVVGILGFALGMAAAPWLWGCWFLVLIALVVRWYQADETRRTLP
jgi:hypothetical protein